MPSLSEIWQAALMLPSGEIGDWMQLTVTTAATGSNELRTVTSSALINSDGSFDDDHYGLWYLWVPDTGEQRRVLASGGFNAVTGALLLNAPLAAVLPVGTEVWIMRQVGVIRYQGEGGLREAVNAALADLSIERYITVEDGGTYEVDSDGVIDVSDLEWITQDRILGLRRQEGTSGWPTLIPGQPHLRRNGDTFVIEPQITLDEGDTIYIDLAWPANLWVKVRERAEGTVTLTAQAVTSIAVSDGGSGYASAPTVTIYGGGGSGATATATVANGSVTGFVVTAPGTGYTSTPGVIVSAPTGGSFAESAVGVVNDDDVVVPHLDVLVPAVLYHTYLMKSRGAGEASAFWDAKATLQLGQANDEKEKFMPSRQAWDDMLLEDAEGAIDETSYLTWPD